MSKFKLNWGWSILLVYITFVGVFLFLLYRSFIELKSNELVTEDYYEKELVYGQEIKKRQNADTMRIPVKILQDRKNLVVEFPVYLKNIQGEIRLYKPDNSKLDRKIPLKLNNHNRQIIDSSLIIPGRWNVTVEWQSKHVPYLVEKKMTLN